MQKDHLEMLLEDIPCKFDLVLDAVAADLSAHRADTEAHHGMYQVKEAGEGAAPWKE